MNNNGKNNSGTNKQMVMLLLCAFFAVLFIAALIICIPSGVNTSQIILLIIFFTASVVFGALCHSAAKNQPAKSLNNTSARQAANAGKAEFKRYSVRALNKLGYHDISYAENIRSISLFAEKDGEKYAVKCFVSEEPATNADVLKLSKAMAENGVKKGIFISSSKIPTQTPTMQNIIFIDSTRLDEIMSGI